MLAGWRVAANGKQNNGFFASGREAWMNEDEDIWGEPQDTSGPVIK